MILRAWISLKGVRWVPDIGTKTFTQIFSMRPDNHRYAITERVHLKGLVEFWSLDLYNVKVDIATITAVPEGYRVYPSLDAAIMGTSLTYKEKG